METLGVFVGASWGEPRMLPGAGGAWAWGQKRWVPRWHRGAGLCRDTAGSRRWRSPRLIIQPLGRLGNAAAARRRGGGGDRDICPPISQGSGTATAPLLLLLLLLQPLSVGMQVLIPMVPWGPQRAGDARCRRGG